MKDCKIKKFGLQIFMKRRKIQSFPNKKLIRPVQYGTVMKEFRILIFFKKLFQK